MCIKELVYEFSCVLFSFEGNFVMNVREEKSKNFSFCLHLNK